MHAGRGPAKPGVWRTAAGPVSPSRTLPLPTSPGGHPRCPIGRIGPMGRTGSQESMGVPPIRPICPIGPMGRTGSQQSMGLPPIGPIGPIGPMGRTGSQEGMAVPPIRPIGPIGPIRTASRVRAGGSERATSSFPAGASRWGLSVRRSRERSGLARPREHVGKGQGYDWGARRRVGLAADLARWCGLRCRAGS